MEYFLVRLTYTPAAWREIVDTAPTLKERLAPVHSLLQTLGGSLAQFGFFQSEASRGNGDPVVVQEKFALWGGHDLITVLAMPSKEAALAFNHAISAEPGLSAVDLTPLVPWEDALSAVPMARDAIEKSRYKAPARSA